jgi:penicillin-binding protein 2
MKSSNNYFATNGLIYGQEGIIRLGTEFFLGRKTGFEAGHEVSGQFPTNTRPKGWSFGDTANISFGQGPIAVTPLQMAIMTAAIANGGKILTPRLIDRIVAQDPLSGEPPIFMPSGKIRGQIHVHPKSLEVVREAMLADVEDKEGTGKAAFVSGLRVCGKTGTAQVTDLNNKVIDGTTWFASFAPYENARYVVLVMVESGSSGGKSCAPIAGKIYETIRDLERSQKPAKAPLVADVK